MSVVCNRTQVMGYPAEFLGYSVQVDSVECDGPGVHFCLGTRKLDQRAWPCRGAQRTLITEAGEAPPSGTSRAGPSWRGKCRRTREPRSIPRNNLEKLRVLCPAGRYIIEWNSCYYCLYELCRLIGAGEIEALLIISTLTIYYTFTKCQAFWMYYCL